LIFAVCVSAFQDYFWGLDHLSTLISEILHLNLHREFFAAIANKQKRIEYRRQSRYWRKQLEERKYDAMLFRNGYAKDAPEMLLEFRGLRRYGKGRRAYHAIRLGRILKIRRWPKGRP
jgi:hypothetical protein